ncbi:hypothetical protein PBI_SCTP2_369 [Salicola phage SCTP-2]|nr:hypothetical protein PBI_SCTP2_369 [Salicola phage SCTP-2]
MSYLIITSMLCLIVSNILLIIAIIRLNDNKKNVDTFTFTHTCTQHPVIVTDKDGNVYFEKHNNTITKVDPDGYEIWSYDGHTNRVRNIEIDQFGNVYSVSDDETIRKVDSCGNELWTYIVRNINSPE